MWVHSRYTHSARNGGSRNMSGLSPRGSSASGENGVFLCSRRESAAIINPQPSPARCAPRVKPMRNANGIGAHIDSTVPAALPSHSRTASRFSAKYLYASSTPSACQNKNHKIPSI